MVVESITDYGGEMHFAERVSRSIIVLVPAASDREEDSIVSSSSISDPIVDALSRHCRCSVCGRLQEQGGKRVTYDAGDELIRG